VKRTTEMLEGSVSVLKPQMHPGDTGGPPVSARAEEPPRKGGPPQLSALR
jgi:hypothetical protein